MAGVRELFNGERAVVFFFAAWVAVSATNSLVPESLALGALLAAALLVELASEVVFSSSIVAGTSASGIRRFKTRAGVSSGIFLGAVTLPTVMLSRLIQISRMISDSKAGLEELMPLSMQYWITSASCFAVLIFLALLLRRSSNNADAEILKFVLFAAAFYATMFSWSFIRKNEEGWVIAMCALYFICHGGATVILIQHVLLKFPACASFGEATLVSGGLVLYFGNILAQIVSKMVVFPASAKYLLYVSGNRGEMGTLVQGVLLGLLVVPIIYRSYLQVPVHFKILNKQRSQPVEETKSNRTRDAVVFYVSLLVMITMIVPAWLHFVQDFHDYPLTWVFNFVFSEPLGRLLLCTYWIAVICAIVSRFYKISKNSKTERILLRKYYHLVAVIMFLPAVIFEPSFLDLAFATALGVFIVLEMIRVFNIWPMGSIIHQFMNAFTDHRDSEILIISHFSLLLGCALPKWMSSGSNDRPLAPFAGILSLGIGDTMASMIGYKYGVLRWSKTGKKTVEGTAAGITSVLAACSLLLLFLASSGYILSQHWLFLLVAVILSGLLEAYTAQLDNAFIPLVFYSLLCL